VIWPKNTFFTPRETKSHCRGLNHGLKNELTMSLMRSTNVPLSSPS